MLTTVFNTRMLETVYTKDGHIFEVKVTVCLSVVYSVYIASHILARRAFKGNVDIFGKGLYKGVLRNEIKKKYPLRFFKYVY